MESHSQEVEFILLLPPAPRFMALLVIREPRQKAWTMDKVRAFRV